MLIHDVSCLIVPSVVYIVGNIPTRFRLSLFLILVNTCGKISHICYSALIVSTKKKLMLPDTVSTPFIRALRRVMSPLVRLMLTKGMTYPVFMELMKSVFVDVAEQDFRLEEKKQTDSRISLLTGVHRKDVKRLRETPVTEENVANKSTPLGAQVVARWLADQRFCSEVGQPRPLPRSHDVLDDGGEALPVPSFETLVSGINKDIRPRALLDEWLRLGVVTMDEQNFVHLHLDAFVPQSDIAVEPLAAQAQQLGMSLLVALNQQAGKVADAEDGQPTQRFTCGIYFYNTPDEPEAQSQTDSSSTQG